MPSASYDCKLKIVEIDSSNKKATMVVFRISIMVSKLVRKELFQLRNITQQLFHKYLLLTNMGISGILSLTGDVLQQHYEVINRDDRHWDKSRTLRMTASGLSVGFLCHYWYIFLDKRLPGKSFKTVVKKVFIDQLVCSPLYITVFFATTCYMEGKIFEEFKKEVIQKGWRLFLADCIVWPPAQVVNFYFLPSRFRVLYDNLVSLGCDVYTSYVKNEIPIKDGLKSV